MQKNQIDLKVIIEGAVVTSLAMALNYLPHTTGISAVEFSYGLVPMIIFSFRRGIIPGMLAGFSWGILDLILRGIGNGSVMNPLQGFLEYFIAFSLIGLAGLGYKPIHKDLKNGQDVIFEASVFAFIGIFSKYFVHFIAGGYFWSSFAPKGTNPWLYSLVINGGSALCNFVLTVIVLVFLSKSLKELIISRK